MSKFNLVNNSRGNAEIADISGRIVRIASGGALSIDVPNNKDYEVRKYYLQYKRLGLDLELAKSEESPTVETKTVEETTSTETPIVEEGTPSETPLTEVDLMKKTKSELESLAKEKGIEVLESYSKKDIVKLLVV